MVDVQAIAADVALVLEALVPVIDLAAPSAAPTLALVTRLVEGAGATGGAVGALIATVKAGEAISAEQVQAADVALDAGFADLDAAIKDAGAA